jgi:tRNA(Arg) A34 adenosine deaminase TadA
MEPLSQPDIPDPELDRAFMGEALRQAVKAYDAQEVPVGAVIVRGN